MEKESLIELVTNNHMFFSPRMAIAHQAIMAPLHHTVKQLELITKFLMDRYQMHNKDLYITEVNKRT